MPAQPFNVHVDPDSLAVQDLAGSVPVPSVLDGPANRKDRRKKARHGADDERLAARQRSERERSSRAAGVGGGRSYAFRRS
jgi:hypothetical protein